MTQTTSVTGFQTTFISGGSGSVATTYQTATIQTYQIQSVN